MRFYDGPVVGGTLLGTGTYNATTKKWTLATSALPVTGSPHTITADYTPANGNFLADEASRSHTVTQASASTTLSITRSGVAVASGTYGQPVTFTAIANIPAGTTTTGTVKFYHTTAIPANFIGDGVKSGTKTYTLANPVLPARPATPYAIIAVYSGDANINGSTSPSSNYTVNKASTTTTVASSNNPSGQGQNVTFTATVTPSSGSVALLDGKTVTFRAITRPRAPSWEPAP